MILDARGAEVAGNGVNLTERQMAKYRLQNASIGEANDLAADHAVRAMNHLANQIPALIHKVVSEAITGFYHSLLSRGMLVVPEGTNPLQEFEDAQRAHASASDGAGSDGDRPAGSGESGGIEDGSKPASAEPGPEPSGADGPDPEAPAEAVEDADGASA